MNYYKYIFSEDSFEKPVEPIKPTTPHKVHPIKQNSETPNKPEGTGKYGLKHPDGSPCDAKDPKNCPLNQQNKIPEWYDNNASAGVKKAYEDVLKNGYFVSTKPEAQQAWAKQLNGNVWGAKRQSDGSVHFYPKGGEYESKLNRSDSNDIDETPVQVPGQYMMTFTKNKNGQKTPLGKAVTLAASINGGPANGGRWINQNDLFDGAVGTDHAFVECQKYGGNSLSSHGMAKQGLTEATNTLLTILTKGTNPEHNNGQLYYAPLTQPDGYNDGGALGTSGGTSYRDGPLILVAKNGNGFDSRMKNLGCVLVNEACKSSVVEIRKSVQKIRPDIIVEPYSNVVNAVRKLTGR